MADGGQAYQTYNFQVICQDNNNPKQLRSKTISILVAEELKSYTITLGAQDNKEHGGFLNVSTGKSYTLEEVRQMNMKELLLHNKLVFLSLASRIHGNIQTLFNPSYRTNSC